MSNPLMIDLFAEDRGHEEFCRALILRMGRELGFSVMVRPRSARGGHGRALQELALYQRGLLKKVMGIKLPDVIAVVIDSNCSPYGKFRRNVEAKVENELRSFTVIGCPEPHIERWFFAHPKGLQQALGAAAEPVAGKRKCKRDLYKSLLAKTVKDAGHPVTFGGIEFASDVVDAMDMTVACKNEKSLKDFTEGLRIAMQSKRGGD